MKVKNSKEESQILLDLALKAYESENYETAESYCLDLRNQDETSAESMLLLTAIYFQQDKFEKSAELSKLALKRNPCFAEAHSNLGSVCMIKGQHQEALQHYQQAVELKPNFIDGLINLAIALITLHKPERAVDVYRRILKVNPELHCVRNDLGSLLRSLGKPEESKLCYMEILDKNSEFAPAWNNLGCLLDMKDEIWFAIHHFEKATVLDPNLLEAHVNLGKALERAKIYDQAVRAFGRALKLAPDNPVALEYLSRIYEQQGLTDLSIDVQKRLTKVKRNTPTTTKDSETAETLNALAAESYRQGDYSKALEYYKTVVDLKPNYINAHLQMGYTLRNLRDLRGAVKAFKRVVVIDPQSAMAHACVGFAHFLLDEYLEAIESFRIALKINPDYDYAFCQLDITLLFVCDWSDYEERMKKIASIVAKELKRNAYICNIHAHKSMLYQLPDEHHKAIAARFMNQYITRVKSLNKPAYSFRRALCGRLKIGYISSDFKHHPLAHLMHPIPGLHDRFRFEICCFSLSPDNDSQIRAKIARESDHFIDLSTVRKDEEAADIIYAKGIHILVNLNGYTGGQRSSIFALRPAPIQVMWLGHAGTTGSSYLDYIVTNPTSSPVEMAHQYSEKLAHMPFTHYSGGNRVLFPHLMNRLIVHCGPSYDGLIADNNVVINGIDLSPLIDNLGMREVQEIIWCDTEVVRVVYNVLELASSEQIETMVKSGLHQISIKGIKIQSGSGMLRSNSEAYLKWNPPKDILVTSRQQYHLPKNAIIYCNYNQLYKLDPYTFQSWIRILKNVPDSVLWLVHNTAIGEVYIRREAAEHGISKKRIIFSRTVAKEEHVRRGQLADICLDTLVCNGHTTSMDMLWSGTPIVTMPGQTMASRITASMLVAIGCPEFIAKTREEYENIAIRLGTNRDYLRAKRFKVWKARLESPLFDCQQFTIDLEKLYRKMWHRYCREKEPDHIAV